jgi:GT2 family glycosyltransferase
MGILSPLKRQQCLKKYNKELAGQTLSLEQWKAEQAAFVLSEELAQAAILYGDYIDDVNGKQEPIFLPDFSPNRWDYEDYLGRAVYVRRDLYEGVDWEKTSRRSGLKKVMENSVQVAETVSLPNVVHVRKLLSEEIPGFVKLDKRPSKGKYEVFSRAEVQEEIAEGVSVIIPSKDHPDMLKKCVQSLAKTTDEALEIIIVDNGSYKDNRVRVEAMCKNMAESTGNRFSFQYIYEPMEFHFSKMCNMGAQKAGGKYVLFLNDDVEAVESGWLTEMLEQAMKPYTGAVGMKLLYPDGKRIQHTGIMNLPMGPVHKMQFAEDDKVYYDKRNRGIHNVCAVTGACLMMRKELFWKLGGMSLELPVAFNDVALCFAATEQGYFNVVCCDSYMMHHESISRGQDTSEEKRGRLLRERSKLYEMYPKQVSFDPFYPYETATGYGLCHAYLDTAIRPAYEDGVPTIQRAAEVKYIEKAKEKSVFYQKPEHEKLNPCLKLQVEQLYQEEKDSIHVAGYSFVIGSDNSHFSYTLVLRGENKLYSVELKPVRRYDLEQNMSDQVNVGLAGFHVQIPVKCLSKGRYRVEVYATDETSSLRLKQNSNVYMHIN